MRLALFPAAAIFFSVTLFCHADTLDSESTGVSPNASGYLGQSFPIAGSGTYTDITFNFFAYGQGTTPYALGTGYLFSTPYTGTPADLSSSDPYFVGSAQASNGVYSFGPSVVLNANTGYFFYEDAPLPVGAISGQVAAHSFFYTANVTTGFQQYVGRSNNYLVTGVSTNTATSPATVTPEPAGFLLLGTGLLGLLAVHRRREPSHRP